MIRGIALCARRAFTARVRNAAAGGIALKSLEEARRSVASGRFRFEQYWPVVGINSRDSVNSFVGYLERSTRGKINLEVSLDAPNAALVKPKGNTGSDNHVTYDGSGFSLVDTNIGDPFADDAVETFVEGVKNYQKLRQLKPEVVQQNLPEIKQKLGALLNKAGENGWEGMLREEPITVDTKNDIAALLGRKLTISDKLLMPSPKAE